MGALKFFRLEAVLIERALEFLHHGGAPVFRVLEQNGERGSLWAVLRRRGCRARKARVLRGSGRSSMAAEWRGAACRCAACGFATRLRSWRMLPAERETGKHKSLKPDVVCRMRTRKKSFSPALLPPPPGLLLHLGDDASGRGGYPRWWTLTLHKILATIPCFNCNKRLSFKFRSIGGQSSPIAIRLLANYCNSRVESQR